MKIIFAKKITGKHKKKRNSNIIERKKKNLEEERVTLKNKPQSRDPSDQHACFFLCYFFHLHTPTRTHTHTPDRNPSKRISIRGN